MKNLIKIGCVIVSVILIVPAACFAKGESSGYTQVSKGDSAVMPVATASSSGYTYVSKGDSAVMPVATGSSSGYTSVSKPDYLVMPTAVPSGTSMQIEQKANDAYFKTKLDTAITPVTNYRNVPDSKVRLSEIPVQPISSDYTANNTKIPAPVSSDLIPDLPDKYSK